MKPLLQQELPQPPLSGRELLKLKQKFGKQVITQRRDGSSSLLTQMRRNKASACIRPAHSDSQNTLPSADSLLAAKAGYAVCNSPSWTGPILLSGCCAFTSPGTNAAEPSPPTITGIQFYSWTPPAAAPRFAFAPRLAPAAASDAAAIITVTSAPFENGSLISTLTVKTTLGGSNLPDTVISPPPPIVGASHQTVDILVTGLNKVYASRYAFTVSSANNAGVSEPSLPAQVPSQPTIFPTLPPPTVTSLPTVPPLPTATPPTTTPPDPPYNVSIVPQDNSVCIFLTQGNFHGNTLTGYEYTTDGGVTWISTVDTLGVEGDGFICIRGLTNGIPVTIQLRAVAGPVHSSPSESVTAAPIPSWFYPQFVADGPILWLDGQQFDYVNTNTAGRVISWNDKAQGNDFTAGGGLIQHALPSSINKRPALRFSQAAPTMSTYLRNTNLNLAPNDTMTLFIVMCRDANSGRQPGYEEIFSVGDDGVLNPWQTFDLFAISTGLLRYNVGSVTQIRSAYDLSNTPALISMVTDLATVNLFTSGSPAITNGARTNPPSGGASYNLNANHTWRISGGALLGDIGEIIVYPSVLSVADRQRIEGFLAWKWGMQTSLPSSHLYYRYPPPAPLTGVSAAVTGISSAAVYFTPPTQIDGVSITGYTVTSVTPNTSIAVTGSTSPISVTGLSPGVQYSFKVIATTLNGDSIASAVSNLIVIGSGGNPHIAIYNQPGVAMLWTPPATMSVTYLVVGGGGGGGGAYDNGGGGGGGGGQCLTGTISETLETSYPIQVGAGGAGGNATSAGGDSGTASAASGGNTTFGSITALGGGAGGGSLDDRTGSGGAGGPEVQPQPLGGRGGRNYGTPQTYRAGGGGGSSVASGGAGGSGSSSGTFSAGGAGGAGTSSAITGSSVTYGAGGAGGAFPGIPSNARNGYSGAANTGAGGGGASAVSSSAYTGGSGGSGIVVLSYTLPT